MLNKLCLVCAMRSAFTEHRGDSLNAYTTYQGIVVGKSIGALLRFHSQNASNTTSKYVDAHRSKSTARSFEVER